MCIRRFYPHLVGLLPDSHGILAHCVFSDGYINENGTINMKRLQVLLNEMRIWEREIFEKAYADINWFKGKQSKHAHDAEVARKRTGLGLLYPMPVMLRILMAVVFYASSDTSAARNIRQGEDVCDE